MEKFQVKEKEKETHQHQLQQQFNRLQQDWASFNQSNPHSLRRSSTTHSNSCNNSIADTLHLLNNSPRSLMCSLQYSAVEEIRWERRAAMESGELKGRRRLFEEVGFGEREEVSEVRSVSSSYASDDDGINGGGEEEVGPVSCHCLCCCSSCSSSSSWLGGGERMEEREKLVVEGEKEVVVVGACMEMEEKRGGVSTVVGGYGGRRSWMIATCWLAIALIVFALGIISVKSFDGYGDENEVILVPT